MKKIILSCLLLLGLTVLSVTSINLSMDANPVTDTESSTVGFSDSGSPKALEDDWGRTVF